MSFHREKRVDGDRELIKPVVRGVEWAGNWEEIRTTARVTWLFSLKYWDIYLKNSVYFPDLM